MVRSGFYEIIKIKNTLISNRKVGIRQNRKVRIRENRKVRVGQNRRWPIVGLLALSACASIPSTEHKSFHFPPDNAFVDMPPSNLHYRTLGWVRAKETFVTLDPESNLRTLCHNYYNKAVASLLREAHRAGGDAVAKVRSITFLLNGKVEEFKTAECSDDGGEGEILLSGVAIQWDRNQVKSRKVPSVQPDLVVSSQFDFEPDQPMVPPAQQPLPQQTPPVTPPLRQQPQPVPGQPIIQHP